MKQEVQIYITRLLKLLEEKIPSGKANHNFQINDGQLYLWIMINNLWQSIIFDENYEDKSPETIIEEIIIELKKAGYKID